MSTQTSPSESSGRTLGISSYYEFWQMLHRRQGRIALMTLLGLGTAALFCVVGGPWYDSSTQLLVVKKRLDTTPITGPDQSRAHEDYLSTHMLLITSRRVIGNAIEKGELQRLEQFGEGGMRQRLVSMLGASGAGAEAERGEKIEKLTTEIIDSLVVSRDAQKPGINPSNEVINLSFRGKVAPDCPRVLNAIIASYQDFLKETYRNTNAETLELIAQARVSVEKDLQAKEGAYQRFLAETPPLWKTQDRGTAQQDRILKIDAKLAALRMRRTEIDASIAMIVQAVKNGRDPTALVVRMLSGQGGGGKAQDPGIRGAVFSADAGPSAGICMEEELVRLQLQKAKLVALSGSKHPEVLALGRQYEAVARLMVPRAAAAANNATELDLGAIKVELLNQELDDLRISEHALTKLFDNEQKGVSASYIHEIQDEAHRKGIERDRQLYDSIVNRLKETSTVKDFGGYHTQVIGPALTGAPAARKYLLIFGLGLVIGLFTGLGWAYVTDQRLEVRSPKSEVSDQNPHARPVT